MGVLDSRLMGVLDSVDSRLMGVLDSSWTRSFLDSVLLDSVLDSDSVSWTRSGPGLGVLQSVRACA